ncbi:DNA cytosine methyltransferase [Lentzea sp. NEAU-D7]|uniref:DNA cytosine methyltransferase n=1 Tax=Lentzea sp. NEAU-D7 TaxID=2994667 RepID=UPI00224B65A4|nr:DNA cytosine methyltransferase [Lentzea sp. NEAU-D7]MCX2949985.1 DNA cytosine methyltransferase [Lentzea sp. NEAU-D7]
MIPEQPVSLQPGQIHMVDLFAGPGGLDVAAHWLGMAVDGIEWDGNACATRVEAGLRTWKADVRDHMPSKFKTATVLAGGPPCQTYTVAGSGTGRRALEQVLRFVKRMAAGEKVKESLAELDDDRTGLVLEPLRWALEAVQDGRPYDAIVLEQVPAVLPVWNAVREALEGVGYKADCGILHTEMYGVPQTRRRAILIARRDRKPSLPAPTHRRYRKGVPPTEGDSHLLPWETMGKAVHRDSPYVVISNYGTGGDPKARGRRTSDEPAATVTGKVSRNRLVTHDEHELERFSIAEAGRLQTFPIDYPWAGRDKSQQIGNAIPPRLAAHVLAAALGVRLDESALDAAVQGKWEVTKNSKPLAPKDQHLNMEP